MERAILITVVNGRDREKVNLYQNELFLLAKSSGVDVIFELGFVLKKIDPAFYLSTGKIEKVKEIVDELNPDVVIFGINLKASQQRNIEDLLCVKTIDYTQLILDIFAKHAKSLEGKMQVELAQLSYLLPRLSGRGIMLSRLGGGIGTRGPGETKLEVDRRRIAQRITKLKKELEKYRQHRKRMRYARKRHNLHQISLVGYTSAGKSTLLNALTKAEQKVSSELFTTLDPLSKKIRLSDGRLAIISDTVGFIDRLPHSLIEAFKATLEEVVVSDLLLLVLDGADPDWQRKVHSVFEVLEEIGAGEKPIIVVVNKIDIADLDIIDQIKEKFPDAVFISALKSQGLQRLIVKISDILKPSLPYREVMIPYSMAGQIAKLHQNGKVIEEKYLENGILVKGYFNYPPKE